MTRRTPLPRSERPQTPVTALPTTRSPKAGKLPQRPRRPAPRSPALYWRAPLTDPSHRFEIREPIDRARAYCADLADCLGETIEMIDESGAVVGRWGCRLVKVERGAA